MRKRDAILLYGGWVAAHLLFFQWYHRQLELDFTLVSVFFVALFCLWPVSLVVAIRSWPARLIGVVGYLGMLIWAIVNFAYFQVFHRFLPLSIAKVASLNEPMAELAAEFRYMLPWQLAAATLGLFALFIVILRFSRDSFATNHGRVTVNLTGNARIAEVDAYRGRRWSMMVVGLVTQALYYFLVTGSVAAYQGQAADKGADPTRTLGGLGVYGFAVAARQASDDYLLEIDPDAPENFSRPIAETIADGAGLTLAKKDIEVLRASIDSLTETVPPVDRVAVKPMFSKKPDIIMYQLESVASWAIEQEPSPMPFLKSLMARSGTVGDYIANGCTTIDAEFAVNCGFFPDTQGPVSDLYSKNDYRCLPSILKDLGYSTTVYHANDVRFWSRDALAPAWGFEKMLFTPEFKYRQPDGGVLDRVVDEIKSSDGPGYHYVIGMTSHSPHNRHFQDYYRYNFGLDIASWNEPLDALAKESWTDEETVRTYLGFLKATDDGLRKLFDRLERENLLDKTIVAVFADHRYYGFNIDDPLKKFRAYNRLPLALHVPGMKSGALSKVASHVDLAPTLYDLAGGQAALPPTFVGQSLFSIDRKPYAINKCLGHVSYYDGKRLIDGDAVLGSYRMLEDGVQTTTDHPMIASLKKIRSTGDMMLKKNELGLDGVLWAAAGEIRLDQMTDADKDGLSDLRERALKTDAKSADSDGDGYLDGIEVSRGYDPRGPGRLISSGQ